jgi:SNF2 family DNA or RNA helicase
MHVKEYMEVETMDENTSHFSEGENVKYISTGKVGTINKVIKGSRGYSYKVTIDGKIRTIGERFLEPFIDTEEMAIDYFIKGNFGDYKDYKIFQTWFRLSRPLENNLYSRLGSKTIFNPHQFKPLSRFLYSNSDERLFIADEVGVGKTIESGIILIELLARERLDYHKPILIVCPNSLGPKWANEMKERFRLNFHLHDGKSLRYTLETTLQDGIFPQRYIFSITSLQLIRREEYLTLLNKLNDKKESPPFGMVIIDEAHHMRNLETDSYKMGELLSGMTEMMLMLSATPLNLKNEDLYNQMHILNPILFPDEGTFKTLQNPVIKLNVIRRLIAKNTLESQDEIILRLEELSEDPLGQVIYSHPGVKAFIKRIENKNPFTSEEFVKYDRLFVSLNPLFYSFTRTRKREALEHQVQREAWELPISLSSEEMKFHDDALETIENYYLSKGGDPQALGLVTNMYRRMISSCIPAMEKYLEWCIEENKNLMEKSELPDEIEDDSQLVPVALDPELKLNFIHLIDELKKIEDTDSKYEQFRQLIEKILANPETPQVMVFSFFIRTLEYLKRRLEADGFTVGIIHGKIPVMGDGKTPDRYEIMNTFKRGRYQILLSSDVGGEGLDFQYCHAIVNYDLPYNPMRVEQRIGRIDRFGQKADKIIVANLFIEETIDEEIYDRLYRRIHLVEDGVGALEPILGKEIADIQTAIISGELTEEQKEEQSQRLEKRITEAKFEMEDFEKHRKDLLSDDYLAKSISKGDFIVPEDAINLTEQFLSMREGCNFVRTEDGRGEMILSGDTVSSLEEFLRRPKNEEGYNELRALLVPDSSIKVVFDGSIADEFHNHVFLSPTGYWARFLISKLEEERKISKTFSFGVKPSKIGIREGEYIVFLFEVRLEGIRTEIKFFGVPVDVNSNLVIKVNLEDLPRALSSADGFDINYIPEEIDPNFFFDIAIEYFEELLDEKRKEAADENRYRIESRITALKRSSEIKVKKLQQQIEKHIQRREEEGKESDEFYIRATTAKIDKEKVRLGYKIKDIQKYKELSLDYNLVGIIYLKVAD